MSGDAPASQDANAASPNEVIQKVDRQAIRQFVTELKTAEQQVGEHIIEALADDQTVAVLTTVVMGPDGRQRIVSAGLDPRLMAEVQSILVEAQEKRVEEVPCVGFHCYVRNRDDDNQAAQDDS